MHVKFIERGLVILIGSCLAIVVVSTFLQVLFRFVFKIPVPWTEEVTRIAFADMVFLGAAYAVKENRHLSVDVISSLPRAIRSAIISIGYLIMIIFLAIFTYYGWVYSINSQVQTTPTLEIPLLFLYIIMPISGVIMLFYLIIGMLEELKNRNRVVEE